jgi:rod shape-determining protein MreB
VNFLNYIFNKILGKFSFFKPEVVVGVPSSINGTEKRALVEALLEANAKEVFIVKEPVLAAIGSGVSIQEPVGRMILNLGAGTTDVAVISLGGVVFSKSIKVGGSKMDESILNMVREKHKCVIGERSAEMIKIAIGGAMPTKEEKAVKVKGRDFETGQPKEVTIHKNEVADAIEADMAAIVNCAKEVFAETPPELSSDIMDHGILLCGGGAFLGNISEFLEKKLHIPVTIVEEPKLCVAKGLGVILDNMDVYKRALVSKN